MDILKGITDALPKVITDSCFEGANIVLYTDNIEFFRTGENQIKELFNKENAETLTVNVITHEGRLKNFATDEIIKRFCDFRKTHLIRRFKRLAGLEQEKIERNYELIRFIKEKWNEKVIGIKSKSEFEAKLKGSKFVYFEWLASIPVYRMTLDEVRKCDEAIEEAKTKFAEYTALYKQDTKLTGFMIAELDELKNKWDKAQRNERRKNRKAC